ncbi:TonB-dependent receptor plug domain-containing protein [Litorilituus lipolyticus]|uniref:TonB-dependent receptor n=1 Tax=Litorilituus lipolyticus TaxID=2491017 RepID=A0A502L337_9GAMM|nr:TonB-dependent receptor [Litorilituus lipolyticus]TPH18380.1 TonB-dependent receptor [Litorilituus lipolyticus]
MFSPSLINKAKTITQSLMLFILAPTCLLADEIEKITVTGSALINVEVANVRSYSVETIRSQGFDNLTDFLQQLTITSGSQLNSNDDSGTARSASSINLRGMGSNRTLVLINGHRMPIYPSAKDGVDNFFNIDGYPLAMIERIDVLPLGGSAIYGSDAVGGVINIILKANLENPSVDLSYGDSSNGGGSKKSLAFNVPINYKKLSGYAIFHAENNEALASEQRPYADEKGPYDLGYWSSFAGYFLDISKNYHQDRVILPTEEECKDLVGEYARWQGDSSKPCKVSHYSQRNLFPEDESYNFLTSLNYQTSDNWQYQSNWQLMNKTTKELGPPQRFGMYLFASENTPKQLKTSLDSGDHIYRVLRSINEYGQQEFIMKDKSFSTLQKIVAELDEGQIEFSWQFATKKLDHTSDQIIEQVLLGLMTPDPNEIGRWYPLSTMSADMVEKTQGISKQEAKAKSQQFQLVWRSDFESILGETNYALLTDVVKESYSDTKDEQTLAREFHKYFAFHGNGSRTRYALASEFNTQFTTELSANLALRYDYYDDVSNVNGAFTPAFTIQYASNTWQWNLRLGRHFRAPDLQRVYMGDSQLIGSIRHGLDPNDRDRVDNYQLILGGSTELTEEKGNYWDTSLSYDFGQHKLTANLWGIDLDGAVYTEGSYRLLGQPELYDFTGTVNSCDELSQPGFITHNGVNSNGDSTVELSCIKKAAVNIASQRHKGVDIIFHGKMGAVSYNFTASKLLQADYLAYQESDRFSFTEQAFRPESKVNFTLDYHATSALSLALHWLYQGSAKGDYNALDENSELIESTGKVSPYQQVNVFANYKLTKDISIKFTIANILDNEPSFYRQDDDDKNHLWPYFNRGLYSPVGRYFSLLYSQQF